MPRCVIIGGAPIGDYERARRYLRPDDFMIYCDSGLKHAEGLGAGADLIVGDFDSFDADRLPAVSPEAEIITLSPVKDDTDSSHAVSVAIEMGCDDFLFLGMLGRRIDHSLANLYLLVRLKSLGLNALMIDDWSELYMLGAGERTELDDSHPYFSLINITGLARGIGIEGAKYPLEDAEILSAYNDLGISNEVLPGGRAAVSLGEGMLLVVRDITG